MNLAFKTLQAKREKIYTWMEKNLPILGFSHFQYQAALDTLSGVIDEEGKLKHSDIKAELTIIKETKSIERSRMREEKPKPLMELILNFSFK